MHLDFKTRPVFPVLQILMKVQSILMKIRNGIYAQKKAISPIIATVLIIAVTLIAAVAIGGFVFGIFGSASATANIQVTTVIAPAGGFGTTTGASALTCPIVASGLTTGHAYIALTNTGTAAATVTGVTLTWAGQGNSFTPPATPPCTVGAAGSTSATTYILFPALATLLTGAVTGQTFSGTVSLSNGATVLFTGTFQ
jgi:flagellin-like protein